MLKRCLLATTTLLGCIGVAFASAGDLDQSFAEPPESARAWAYWWWLDSYATKEGITRDLEEMKRQGIGGALLFDAGEGKGSPVGPKFMSDAWRELFKHAVAEADRLGIVLTANLCSGWNAGGTWVTPEFASKTVVFASTRVQGPGAATIDLRPKLHVPDYYHDIVVYAFPGDGRPSGSPGIKHYDVKAGRRYLNVVPDALEQQEPTDVRDCASGDLIDLTDKLDASGRLHWRVPEGTYTIVRLGYGLLGAKTSCMSPNTQGYEIDFFNADAYDLQWNNTAAKMIADAGPLTGTTFRHVHEDSYEVHGAWPEFWQQNWTPKFLEEFTARRGYDPTKYLPVLAGYIIDSREISNRFLWDYRRTISDLFTDRHFRRMQEHASRAGLGIHPESAGPFWPCIDALSHLGLSDIPMGEFWKRAPEKPDGKIYWEWDYHICDTVRQAASAAHVYGKPVCQAEAWTCIGPNWEEDFYDFKDLGDRAFCAGLTRNVLCFYVHQAELDVKPGYQWEFAGTHFDRNVTWWDQADAWLTYLARCQHLLRQGKFVADLCYYYGEGTPNYVPAKHMMRPAMPPGYDCDTINTDVLFNRVGVEDGRIVLPDGMSYRYLVLPERSAMSPAVLGRIKQLVEAGATIVGDKPRRAPGLTDYPRCDEQVRELADALWGKTVDAGGSTRTVGKGRVMTGKPLDEVFAADNLAPDFAVKAQAADAKIDWIHRRGDGIDIWFLANLQSRDEIAECTFRIAGRQPEIWDAVTGEQWDAAAYRIQDGRTTVPMRFASRQSFFVVFRKPADSNIADGTNFPEVAKVGELTGPWTVRFDPKWGGPESVVFEKLVDWTTRPEPGIKFYSGTAVYEKTFDLPADAKADHRRVYLDLGQFENVAEVKLNGRDLGVIWTAPWHVDITQAVQPAGNKIEIAIVNLWPNRLIGDAALPENQRLTVTNVKKFKPDSPLMPSGLFGPVTIKTATMTASRAR